MPSQGVSLQMKFTPCHSLHSQTACLNKLTHTHTVSPHWLPISVNDSTIQSVAHTDNLQVILDSSPSPSHSIHKYILTLTPSHHLDESSPPCHSTGDCYNSLLTSLLDSILVSSITIQRSSFKKINHQRCGDDTAWKRTF